MASHLYIPLYEAERSAAPATVLVTGATGFVAGPIVERLLAAGHTVHATVRDPSNTKMLTALQALPGADERLKIFKANLLEPGSFDEAIKGCKYVLHTASPFFLDQLTVAEVKAKLLEPAVNGTVNVLDAVNKCETVERVVLTSSVAAIYTEDHAPPYTEEDWANTVSETNLPYYYSKKLAEEKAWEIAKAQNRWKLVCINPSYVFGPPTCDRLDGESIKIISEMLHGNKEYTDDTTPKYGVVDVRDVAAAHTLAMVHPNAQGRNIVCEGNYSARQLLEMVHEKFPEVKVPEVELVKGDNWWTNSKIQKEMGFKFHDTKTCMQDMVAKLVDIGRVNIPSA